MNWNSDGNIDPYFSPADHIADPYWANVVSAIFGTIYSLIYLILINLVLLAVIAGFIIDTFASMREKKEFIDDDMRNQCFICSIGRDQFEQAGLSFEKVSFC